MLLNSSQLKLLFFFLVFASTLYIAKAQKPGSACSLLSKSELESALQGKASGFNSQETNICTGKVGAQAVIIRYAERKAEAGVTKEQKAIEILKKQGWKINVKKDGDVTVSSVVPPSGSAACNTTASIFRNGTVVAVEVSSKDKETMPSMDVVSALVKKAYSRLK